jgi:hypothetical protein
MSAEIADTGDLKRKEIVPDIDELEKTGLIFLFDYPIVLVWS